jgi:signal transduction histidine kinase
VPLPIKRQTLGDHHVATEHGRLGSLGGDRAVDGVDGPLQLVRRLIPKIDAEASRIEQVLTDLLVNAAKFTPTGGQVRLAADSDGGVVRFCVGDNGIGIEPLLLNRVFEPYFQTTGPRNQSPAGLGLGLALVKSLVELQGGQVTAHSDGPGRGAEFVVSLPVDSMLTCPLAQ